MKKKKKWRETDRSRNERQLVCQSNEWLFMLYGHENAFITTIDMLKNNGK